jgi:hypothetical protein
MMVANNCMLTMSVVWMAYPVQSVGCACLANKLSSQTLRTWDRAQT